MSNKIKFVHTNIIAKDWEKLAQFYIDVFGCEPTYPKRDLYGDWIDKMTGIANVKIRGIHLKLPGYNDGPTLEIFGYNEIAQKPDAPLINDQGFGHIAFHVSNVEETINKLVAGGGVKYGELIEKEIKGLGVIKAIYARDPEGNIIEIQNWKKN
jgi:catechol 2,3-dioxygenase-like lactoylglutathione lyase family enzyme